jgi:PAS domain S-box-containing protein
LKSDFPNPAAKFYLRASQIEALRRQTTEERLIVIDGARFDAGFRNNGDKKPEVFLEVFAFPMLDDQGRVMGVVDYVRNVSARKRAEKAVQGHNQQYRKLFETSLLPILLIDPRTGAVVEANSEACRFYGYSYEKLTQLNIADINLLGKEAVMYEMQRVLDQGGNSLNFRHRLSNGEIREVEVFTGPIFLNSGPYCALSYWTSPKERFWKKNASKEKNWRLCWRSPERSATNSTSRSWP